MCDDKTRELIERYCSEVDRNVVLFRSVNDKRCVCLNRDSCALCVDCKYDTDTHTGNDTSIDI